MTNHHSTMPVWVAAVGLAASAWVACGGRQPLEPPGTAGSTSGGDRHSQLELRSEIELALQQRVLASEGRNDMQVTVAFDTLPFTEVTRVLGMRSHGHGTGIELIELSARDPRTPLARSVRCDSAPSATLDSPPPVLIMSETALDAEVARGALRRIAVALSARVSVGDPLSSEGRLALRSLAVTDDNQVLVLKLCNAAQCATRARLLGIAAALPGPELVPLIAPSLDAEERLSVLAINALAHASGRDLRHSADGVPREREAIVKDYKRLDRRISAP